MLSICKLLTSLLSYTPKYLRSSINGLKKAYPFFLLLAELSLIVIDLLPSLCL
nr:MAG TPA_asm: hypothetical protein [Bacteriophage sp.]